jgi:acyl dehydratase
MTHSLSSHSYDELEIGQSASLERVCTLNDLVVFAHASGNLNPTHLPGFAERDTGEKPAAPAMWGGSLFSALLGNVLPGAGTVYLGQTLRFHSRVHPGDKLKVTVMVRAKKSNHDEIRWIVENLFVGDRFSQGELRAGRAANFDMRDLRSPIILFASAGDNITPPGQALRWIADVYRDEQEIKALGQIVVYLLHDQVGHLGIFVSSAVARKEHSEIANTLQLIEAVAPGLYEMRITGDTGEGHQVELVERQVADIRAISGEARNEAFPAVAKISARNQHLYDVIARVQ